MDSNLDKDIEAVGASDVSEPLPPLKNIVVDEIARGRQHGIKHEDNKGGKQVTFDEVVVVTPYRVSSTSVPENQGVVNSDVSAPDRIPGFAYPHKRIQFFTHVSFTIELAMLLLALSSLLVMLAGAYICANLPVCEGLSAFAIAVGAVSLFFNGIMLFFIRKLGKIDEQIFGLTYLVLCIVWFISGIALTIPATSPFLTPRIGFFATWASFVLSTIVLGAGGGELREVVYVLNKLDALTERTRTRQLLLVVCSLFLVIANAASFCATACVDYVIFALVWSIFCTVFSGVLFLQWKELESKQYFWVSFILAFLLTVGSGIVSILGPFNNFGATGMFGSWIAVFFSWAAHFSPDPRERPT